ncbi:hypothetical protein HEB94_008347 [Actinopolymorpha pittospori]|uniref:Uncharacterized protein n=1 Tax=Actinopolymorpha pittospori TaxID=648752 RepID=A0A927N3K6_9ACTN|nr:hypothetical protein [Actinopolymorpha pittospori]
MADIPPSRGSGHSPTGHLHAVEGAFGRVWSGRLDS